MNKNIKIICPIHGEFEQRANSHFRGKGCRGCSVNKNSKISRGNTQSFIKKSKKLYKDKFDYSKTEYGENAFDKLILICKEHGEFNIMPNTHLAKRGKGGCPYCAKESTGWNRRSWRRACENGIATLYIIECYNDKEKFYKIGITSRDLNERFKNKTCMPYNYKVIELIKSEDSDYIFNLERKLHKINKAFRYKPLIQFDGDSECFLYGAMSER